MWTLLVEKNMNINPGILFFSCSLVFTHAVEARSQGYRSYTNSMPFNPTHLFTPRVIYLPRKLFIYRLGTTSLGAGVEHEDMITSHHRQHRHHDNDTITPLLFIKKLAGKSIFRGSAPPFLFTTFNSKDFLSF